MRVGRRWALLALAVGQLTFGDVGQVVRRTLVRLHAEPAPESKKAEVLSVKKYGAKLALGVDKPGFLHVANFLKPEGTGFIENLQESKLLSEGDEIEVRAARLLGPSIERSEASSGLERLTEILQNKRWEVEVVQNDRKEFGKKPMSDFKAVS